MASQREAPLSQLETERARAKKSKRPSLEQWKTLPVTHSVLDKHGYVWHPGLQILLCLVCKSAVTVDGVKAHCERNPGHEYVKKEARNIIEQLGERCEFADREGRLPNVGIFGSLPPIEGFDIFQAYRCSTCGKLYQELLSLQRHFNKMHKPLPMPIFQQVPAQHLFKGKYGVCFAIDEGTDLAFRSDSVDAATAKIARDLQLQIAQKLHDEYSANWTDKAAWSYLKSVPWHEVLEANHEEFTVTELKALINIPPIHTPEANGTLAKSLALGVEDLVLRLEIEIKHADYRVMAWLGSDTDIIEKSKCFHWLNRKTVIRYSRTLAQLALFACHLADLKDRYSVDFDKMHSLSERVGNLAKCVMEDYSSDSSRTALLGLFEEIIEYQGQLMESAQDQYIVFHFLALRHLRNDGGFPPPIDVTQPLAHLQWCFRLIMFQKLRRKLKMNEAMADARNDRDPVARAQREKALVKETFTCLHVGECTQMGTIHTMKGILRHHAEQHPRPPLARWDDLSFTRLYCEGKLFSLEGFCNMNDNLLNRSRTLLKELMFGEDARTWLTVPKVVHDREGKSGDLYSFLMDRDNGFDYLTSTFAQRMLKRFVVGNIDGKLQLTGVCAYLSKCRAMLDLIAAMMHITCGGAPRAEEAVQTRILEGKEGKRNVYHMRGKIGWVLEYNKSKSQKPIARFLARATSVVIVEYLLLIRPLEVLLCQLTLGKEDVSVMMTHLFASDGERWTADHYGIALEQAFVQEMNEEIGVREYRQIQAALSGHYLSKWKELAQDTDEASFEQQGHTTETHDREYDRVMAQAHGIKENHQIRFELASFYWQQLVFPSSVQVAVESENRGSAEKRMDIERTVLPHDMTDEEDFTAPNTPGTEIVVPLTILKALRRVLRDETATFRAEQQAQAAMAMTLQNDNHSWFFRKDILVVLPTGMGKTLTWLVAGEVEEKHKLAIVIVPLNALLLDLSARLKAYGREVHVYDPTAPLKLEGMSGSLLISVDRVVQPDTMQEIHTWEHSISRIVVDEAHLAYTARDYRLAMTKLGKVLKARPPVVLLTATCGPSMKSSLLDALKLENVWTIRRKTDRPEIIYAVSPAPPLTDSAIPMVVAEWYRQTLKPLLPGTTSQVLIYVPRITIGEELAQNLALPFYHSGTPPDKKLKLSYAYRDGSLRVLIATAAFGAGIDVDAVDVVIHAGSPRSMVDFAQESGRAGRGGQPALSMVFRSSNNYGGSREGVIGEGEMRSWLEGVAECRRVGLSAYLDGGSTSCAALPHAQICDRCRALGANRPSIEEDIRSIFGRRRKDSLPPASPLTYTAVTSVAASQQTTMLSAEPRSVSTPGPNYPSRTPSFVIPETPKAGNSLKRRELVDTPPSATTDAASKRRAVIRSMQDSSSSPGSAAFSTSIVESVHSDITSYGDRLVPLLQKMVTMSGVCFVCLGGGRYSLCGPGECVNENLITSRGGRNITQEVNIFGNIIKFRLPPLNHCSLCYLPSPSSGFSNPFHPGGVKTCLVFRMAAPKSLTAAAKLWEGRVVLASRVHKEGDPAWLKDILDNSKMLLEPSKECFAKLLQMRCNTGEIWLLRVFYHMVNEALNPDLAEE